MKRKIVKIAAISLSLIAVSMSSYAGDGSQLFNKGDKDVNLMVGFVDTYNWGYAATTSIPAISLSVDYGLRDDWGPGVFSIGGFIGGSSSKYSYNDLLGDKWSYKYSQFVVAARATYHYQFVDKLDTYGGVMAGIRHLSGKYTGTASSLFGSLGDYTYNHFFTPVFAGAKYYFTPKFSVMAELGWEVAWLNLGVCVKL